MTSVIEMQSIDVQLLNPVKKDPIDPWVMIWSI
jgi:hypothetical protein